MISLAVSRTSLGLVPLTATDVTQNGATIADWSPGLVTRDVTIVSSKWAPGGVATRVRSGVVEANLTLFLRASSLTASRALAEAWADALGQLDYTLTETIAGGGVKAFQAMPATASLISDRTFWRHGFVTFQATIPRNPL